MAIRDDGVGEHGLHIHSVWDNEGETFDRYTVVYKGAGTIERDGTRMCVGMSKYPFDPQGFGSHSSCMPGNHLGKRIEIKDLPEDCRKLVEQDMENEE